MKNLLLLFAFHFSFFTFLSAQPGALDLSFNPGTGASFTVERTAIQQDGKIIAAGQFDSFDNNLVHHIARLHSNGMFDTSFHTGTGTDDVIYALTLQPDGKILIGGSFTSYNSQPVPHLARLNTDGTLDTSFHTGTGTNNIVRVFYIQPDGKILTGGDFSNYNGNTCQYLTRLNTDGTRDTTFHTSNGANGRVESIAMLSNNQIYIGGTFTTYAGLYYLRIALLNPDGTPDTNFNQPIGGASGEIMCFAIQNNNLALIAGNYTNYNGSFVNRLQRIFPSGVYDNNFFPGQAASDMVRAVVLQNDGSMLIGGALNSYDGNPAHKIAQLTSAGRFDTTFNIAGSGANDEVSQISLQQNGKIIINGWFTNYNGTWIKRIARLYNCLTPQPDSIFGLSYALCSGTQQTYYVQPVAGATKYEWTLPNGWSGNSDSTSIIATSNGTGGTITAKAFTDSCGWSYVTERNIATLQPANVPICLVTVDTASTHNIVIWEKPITALIDSFLIYRETSTNVYTRIASVGYHDLSEYHDTAANPNATSYRYKISVLDTCGAESDLSDYHNTIHLQNLGSGNFQWTFYQIENQLNPVLSFNIYRDNNNTGNFSQIGNVPGTNATFTDVTFNSFSNSVYVVDANWSISCTPSRAVNTTRSNIRHKTTIDFQPNATENLSLSSLSIYPNPASKMVYISAPANIIVQRVQLINMLGEEVMNQTASNLNIENLPKGIYTLVIETNAGKTFKRLVAE